MVIGVALVIHGFFTFSMLREHGYLGAFPPFATSNTTQIFSDLVIALALVNLWVFFDLRRQGRPGYWFAVHLLGTAAAGSFAPLGYLFIRGPGGPAHWATARVPENEHLGRPDTGRRGESE